MQTSRSISEKPVKDVRTYCRRCAREMYNAKIKTYQTGGERGTCDKCGYHKTSNYIVK